MPNPALEPGEPEILSADVAPWNPEQTLERFGGNEKLLHEVMEIFLEKIPKHPAGLRKAITQHDAETSGRFAPGSPDVSP
jgi:hypothetical protein